MRFSRFSCSMRRFNSDFDTVSTFPSKFSKALYSGVCGLGFMSL